jgi:phosphatidylserine decarboxylase
MIAERSTTKSEDLEGFVKEGTQLGEDRAATNTGAFVMLVLRLGDAHPVHFPIDVADRSRDPSLTGSTDQVA